MKKLLLIIPIVIIMAGCAPISGQDEISCESDSDCGFNVCAVGKIIQPKCQEKTCVSAQSECPENKVCVQDSEGVKCEDAFTELSENKPLISCHLNTNTMKLSGINAFNDSMFACGSDCPKNYFCDMATCFCEKKDKKPTKCTQERIFVHSSNTDSVDDLKASYEYYAYSDEMDSVSVEDREYLAASGKSLLIPAYNYGKKYIPFPEEQFSREPASPNSVPCANEYFEGVGAIDIDKVILARKIGDCGFGPADILSGYLLVCAEDIFDWLDSVNGLKLF